MKAPHYLLAACAAAATHLSFADVTFLPSRPMPEHGSAARTVPGILISGQIKPIDRREFQSALTVLDADLRTHKTPYLLVVNLDSEGGDVETAVAIGKEIRKRLGFVQVQARAKCFSACVLVLAGGAQRVVRGTVGIHRPYMPIDSAVTPKQQREQHGVIGRQVKAYLESVNVPPVLYEHMMRVPPQRIEYLSESEMTLLGLNENDPFIDDALTAAAAQRERLTKHQYFQFEAAVRAECGSTVISEYQKCRKAIRARF